MGSDDLFKKRRGNKKRRIENVRELAPYRYLIVCEGEKTEPNYFEGIKRRINSKYSGAVKVERKRIELDIVGTGRNTNDLVKYTKFIEEVEKLENQGAIPYGHIWVIFDKDDFTDDQFNSAIEQAISKGYNVGWSNESIELWFVLHFQLLNTCVGRQQYCSILEENFKKHNINNGRYKKNIENIFELLCQYGTIDDAIVRSKQLLEEHEDRGITSPARKNLATMIFSLVEELKEYF